MDAKHLLLLLLASAPVRLSPPPPIYVGDDEQESYDDYSNYTFYDDYGNGTDGGEFPPTFGGVVCLCEVCPEGPEWHPPDYTPISRYLWGSGQQPSPDQLRKAIKEKQVGSEIKDLVWEERHTMHIK